MSSISGEARNALTYKMEHDWDVKDLLTAYKRILQRAIDIIWENTEWKEKIVKHNGYKTTRLIPVFPSSSEFKKNLRNKCAGNSHGRNFLLSTSYDKIWVSGREDLSGEYFQGMS
ncbi:MAG: hypothetical protein J7K58_01860 [Euryarchaeota archaeon]|nr:hypothetical protein [Euryarchaeota archaeon]